MRTPVILNKRKIKKSAERSLAPWFGNMAPMSNPKQKESTESAELEHADKKSTPKKEHSGFEPENRYKQRS